MAVLCLDIVEPDLAWTVILETDYDSDGALRDCDGAGVFFPIVIGRRVAVFLAADEGDPFVADPLVSAVEKDDVQDGLGHSLGFDLCGNFELWRVALSLDGLRPLGDREEAIGGLLDTKTCLALETGVAIPRIVDAGDFRALCPVVGLGIAGFGAGILEQIVGGS